MKRLLAAVALTVLPGLAQAQCYEPSPAVEICASGTIFAGSANSADAPNAVLLDGGNFIANILVIDTPEAAGLDLAEIMIFVMGTTAESAGTDIAGYMAGREVLGSDTLNGVEFSSEGGVNPLGFGTDITSVAKTPSGYIVATTIELSATELSRDIVAGHLGLLEQISIGGGGGSGLSLTPTTPTGTCDSYPSGARLCSGGSITATGARYDGIEGTYEVGPIDIEMSIIAMPDPFTMSEFRTYVINDLVPSVQEKPAPVEPITETEVILGTGTPGMLLAFEGDEAAFEMITIGTFSGGLIFITSREPGSQEFTDAHIAALVDFYAAIEVP